MDWLRGRPDTPGVGQISRDGEAKRWVGTVRRERLDHLLMVFGRHLEFVLVMNFLTGR